MCELLTLLIVKSDTFCRAVFCFLINAYVIPVNERFGKLHTPSLLLPLSALLFWGSRGRQAHGILVIENGPYTINLSPYVKDMPCI